MIFRSQIEEVPRIDKIGSPNWTRTNSLAVNSVSPSFLPPISAYQGEGG